MTIRVAEEGGHAEDTTAAPLTGSMGAGKLLFVVLAFSAPMAVVATFLPFMLIFGGDGATLAFVVSAVLLLLFAVGYVAMARHIPKPGAFYVFISSGLGKVAGMAGAFLAITSYLLMLVGSFVATGLAAVDFSASVDGPGVPWWAWALCAWSLVSIVGYFNIEVSGRILALAMVLEIALVLDARLFGVSAVGVMALMIFVSLAVVAWFKRKGVPAGTSPLACFVAPVLSATALTYIVVTAVRHFDLLAGGLPGQNVGLLLVLVAFTVAGAGLAVYFRSSKTQIYDRLGHS